MNSRLAWADIAKAGAILLVVLYHVTGTGMTHLTPGSNVAEQAWHAFSVALLPVRMPLFFLVSGVLAASALQRTWSGVWRGRIADLLWPYLLWNIPFAVIYALAYTPNDARATAMDALGWVLTGAGYWFLPALVAFFLAARALRRAPILLVIISAALWLSAGPIRAALPDAIDPEVNLTIYRWVTFFVWFVIGATARPIIEHIAAAPALLGVVLVAAYIIVVASPLSGPWVTRLLNVVGIAAALVLSGQLARSARARGVGRFIAARTLPIYLIHPILIAAVVVVAQGGVPNSPWLSAVIVPVFVIGIVTISIGFFGVTERRFPWLYRLPGRRPSAHRGVASTPTSGATPSSPAGEPGQLAPTTDR